MRLSTASAQMLSHSRFFNADTVPVDNTRPIASSVSPVQIPIGGQVGLEFYAWDDSDLAGVVLIRSGSVVADVPLAGTWVHETILTPDYRAGINDEWRLILLDAAGNRTITTPISFTPARGPNQAAIPNIRVVKSRLMVSEPTLLDASVAVDPDGSTSALKVEWDLDGDGTYDTPMTQAKQYTARYAIPGTYAVSARLTDSDGAVSRSMPIGIRVDPPAINHLVSLQVVAGRKMFVSTLGACPDGFAGRFEFVGRLANLGEHRITDLMIRVAGLSNGNYLFSRGALYAQGDRLDIPKPNAPSNRDLDAGGAVDIPFTLCLRERTRFQLYVDVLGAITVPD
jgi:hypothetical protein